WEPTARGSRPTRETALAFAALREFRPSSPPARSAGRGTGRPAGAGRRDWVFFPVSVARNHPMGVFAGRSRQPLAAFLCCCLAALIFSAVVLPAVQTARAQDDEAKAEAAPTEPQQQPSLIKHIIKSAGWVFGPMLLVMSIVLVALIVLLAMDLRLS